MLNTMLIISIEEHTDDHMNNKLLTRRVDHRNHDNIIQGTRMLVNRGETSLETEAGFGGMIINFFDFNTQYKRFDYNFDNKHLDISLMVSQIPAQTTCHLNNMYLRHRLSTSKSYH